MYGDQPFEAPELRVPAWLGADGEPLAEPLTLAGLGHGPKVIFAFQHWCRGCHADGFPALQELMRVLPEAGVEARFAVIQTVFEAPHINTYERLAETQARYGLQIPFGHDFTPGQWPSFMIDYRTQGTPWFSVIDASGLVQFNDFYVMTDRVLRLLSAESSDK
ncbi:MAG: hypothetical protein WAW88_03885 [Nocardioides sp.]